MSTYQPSLIALAKLAAQSDDPALAKAAKPFLVLADRAKLTGYDAPTFLVDSDGQPSHELLNFCQQTDLPLDAVFA